MRFTAFRAASLCGVALVGIVAPATAQTVAWYRFNDSTPGETLTTAIDSGPNHLNGVSAGPNPLSYGIASSLPNAGGASLNASGDSDFIHVAENPALDMQGDFSVESYFYMPTNYQFSGDGIADYIVVKQNNPGFGNYLGAWGIDIRNTGAGILLDVDLGFDNGSGGFSDSGVFLTQAKGNVTTGQWHHAALVMDRDFSSSLDSLTLYLDSQQVAQTSGDYPNLYYGSSPLLIGAVNVGNDPNGVGIYRRNFGGLIDEVRISSAALEPSQFLNVSGVAAAPEPSSAAFAVVALGGVVGLVLRRRAR